MFCIFIYFFLFVAFYNKPQKLQTYTPRSGIQNHAVVLHIDTESDKTNHSYI